MMKPFNILNKTPGYKGDVSFVTYWTKFYIYLRTSLGLEISWNCFVCPQLVSQLQKSRGNITGCLLLLKTQGSEFILKILDNTKSYQRLK